MLNAEVPLGTFPLKKSVGAIADRSGAIRHHYSRDVEGTLVSLAPLPGTPRGPSRSGIRRYRRHFPPPSVSGVAEWTFRRWRRTNREWRLCSYRVAAKSRQRHRSDFALSRLL